MEMRVPKSWSAKEFTLLLSMFELTLLIHVFLGSGPDRGQSPVEWGDFPSVSPFVRPFVRPSPPLWAIQPGLRPSQPSLKPETWLAGCLGLRPGWLGLRPGWLGLRSGWLGLRPGWLAQRGGGRTNGRTYKRTNGQKISPFYRTLSPIGAAIGAAAH